MIDHEYMYMIKASKIYRKGKQYYIRIYFVASLSTCSGELRSAHHEYNDNKG